LLEFSEHHNVLAKENTMLSHTTDQAPACNPVDASHTHSHGFDAVDQAARPGAALSYLDTVNVLEAARAYKAQSFRLIGPLDGASVLDIGCGTGSDACQLARNVGIYGHVVGVDNSQIMIEEAHRRAKELALPVEFQVADAHRLEFPDNTFDACRVDRVLQHAANPARVVAEMARVTRPGGRIVAAEPDWGTLVIDSDDELVAPAIFSPRANVRNAGIGRQLWRLFRDSGLEVVQVMPFTAVLPTFELAEQVCQLRAWSAMSVELGHAASQAVDEWFARLEAASRSGRFFAALTGFLVAGRRSGSSHEAPGHD
jgi:ubiquinone/menaquinone biosynthesis C-methylase UbiE